MRKNQKGFTLIELAIVIVILGILAAVAFPRYQELRNDAHLSADAAVIGSIRAGVMTYFAKMKVFPASDNSFFANTLHEPPEGWNFTTATGTITCNGLPTNTTDKATWTYNATSGVIVPGTAHTP